MCGRYTHQYTWREIHDFLDFRWDAALEDPEPSFNVAPTQTAPVMRHDGAAMLRWGLVPSWAKDEKIGARCINARAETLQEKPAFRAAFQQRRCIVPASGFYEWAKVDSGKVPNYVYARDGTPLLLAGLWEARGDLETFAIVTCAANPFMRRLHDRMPVILSPESALHWLDQPVPELLVPSSLDLASHEVSRSVNSPRNNDASLIEAVR